MKLILDLESNGFLDRLDRIHCIVCKDIETQKVYSYNPDNLNDGLELLKKATLLIGHNIQGFDLPALDKVFGFKYKGEILDTLLLSRLLSMYSFIRLIAVCLLVSSSDGSFKSIIPSPQHLK